MKCACGPFWLLAAALLIGAAHGQGLFAALSNACNNVLRPSVPRNLLASSANGNLQLAWQGPANDPCGQVTYHVIVHALPMDASRPPVNNWTGSSTGTGVDGLDPTKSYEASTAREHGGAHASGRAAPPAAPCPPAPARAIAPAPALTNGRFRLVPCPSHPPRCL